MGGTSQAGTMLAQFRQDVSRGGMSQQQQLTGITAIALAAVNEAQRGKDTMSLLTSEINRLVREGESLQDKERILTIALACSIGVIGGIGIGLATAVYAYGTTSGGVIVGSVGGGMTGGVVGQRVGVHVANNVQRKHDANNIAFLRALKEQYDQQEDEEENR